MLDQPITLPNGTRLPNRIAKSAMEEDLATRGVPGEDMCRLYRQWSQGGPGLLITGNVTVDREAPTEPRIVVLENDRQLEKFADWARAGSVGGNPILMQINHPGRQIPRYLVKQPVAPSAVGVEVPGARGLFNTPRALSEAEIEGLIQKFVTTAALGVQAGFDGIQIHAAHGYLISQFLSPLTNRRQDQWGGTMVNRSRFLLRIVRDIRAAIGEQPALAIKLNSADFQRGGFDEADALWLIGELNHLGLDLLEISGGNYESPAMIAVPGGPSQRTVEREAHFLDFAAKARTIATMPVMVTGGFRSHRGLHHAVDSGAVDIVGLAKPFCLVPDLPRQMLDGRLERIEWPVRKLKNQAFDSIATLGWARTQIHRLAKGKATKPQLGTIRNLIADMAKTQLHAARYRRWLRQPGA